MTFATWRRLFEAVISRYWGTRFCLAIGDDSQAASIVWMPIAIS